MTDDASRDPIADDLEPIQRMLHEHCTAKKLVYVCLVGGVDGTLYIVGNAPHQEPVLLAFLEAAADRIRRGGMKSQPLRRPH